MVAGFWLFFDIHRKERVYWVDIICVVARSAPARARAVSQSSLTPPTEHPMPESVLRHLPAAASPKTSLSPAYRNHKLHQRK